MARDDQRPAGPPVISIDPCDPCATFHLLAALAWPTSEKERGHALVKWTASLQAGFEQVVSDKAALRQDQAAIWDLMAAPAGGHAAMRDAPPLDTLEAHLFGPAMFKGAIAGRALCMVATMAHLHPDLPASTNRAWSVMRADMRAGGAKVPDDDGQLKAIWKEWRCIAPLHAAVEVWFTWSATTPDPRDWQRRMHSTEGLGYVLSWAKWFRAWATTYRPQRSPGGLPLIPDAVAVRYDTAVDGSRPPLELCRLSAARLESAKSHRAPTTKHSE